ncbi:hypothetical protein LguiB_003030 [Lonicera macranthoides]
MKKDMVNTRQKSRSSTNLQKNRQKDVFFGNSCPYLANLQQSHHTTSLLLPRTNLPP